MHTHSSIGQRLSLSLALTVSFAILEAATGWLAGSLALLSDAGHMVSDAVALGIAALAARFASRPPSERHSYGLGRLEVVAALANGLSMVVIVVGIVSTALQRLWFPQPVSGAAVIAIAALGLLVNLAVVLILSHGEQTLNTRGVLLHILGDLLGSVAALLSGVIIMLTGWTPVDPILSMIICVFILFSSLRLLWDALQVVMEGVPPHLSLPEVGRSMSQVAGVKSVHDLHIWTLSSGRIALSAHVVIDDFSHWERLLYELRELLHEQFGIDHTTLQPEPFTRILRWLPPASRYRDGSLSEPPDGGSNSK